MVEIGLTDAKTTLKRPSGAPKTSQRWPQNPPKAIFGSKRRANQGHESSKMNLEALFGRSRGPSELPRAAQELPKGARQSPKTLSKFQTCKDSVRKINIFEGGRGSLGIQNRPQEVPRGDKKRHRRPRILPRPSPAARGEHTMPKRVPR